MVGKHLSILYYVCSHCLEITERRNQENIYFAWADPEGGTGGPDPLPPLKNHKNIGFLCNTSPDPLKNHIATKPAFKVGPSSARQQNAIAMVFHWRADDGPFIAVFGSSIPSSIKKKEYGIKFGPPLTKLSGSAHALHYLCKKIYLCKFGF